MPVFLDDQQELEVDGDELVALTEYVLRDRDVPGDMEVSLLLVDESTMADLNHLHMAAEGPTDVLAFPIDEPGAAPVEAPAILGDVVLCPVVAARQAAERDRSTAAELRLLTTHGLLHLLGMDHADGPSEREMFSLTDDLLAGFADRAGR
jgi:probable rRNA maturation factor